MAVVELHWLCWQPSELCLLTCHLGFHQTMLYQERIVSLSAHMRMLLGW